MPVYFAAPVAANGADDGQRTANSAAAGNTPNSTVGGAANGSGGGRGCNKNRGKNRNTVANNNGIDSHCTGPGLVDGALQSQVQSQGADNPCGVLLGAPPGYRVEAGGCQPQPLIGQ